MGPVAGGLMTSPTGDDRFDTREEEVQHYVDWADGLRWTDEEKRDFAETVVRLKEQPVDRDSDADAPTA